MGWNDHLDPDEDDLPDLLNYLIGNEELTGAQLGVAKQVIACGTSSLSPNQAAVLGTIKRTHLHLTCERCDDAIPLCELLWAFDSGLCSWCEHMEGKE